MRARWTRTAVVALLALAAPATLLAQTQLASFTGTVTSKDGNPLSKVEVVATNQATQVAYTARSNDAGLYTISALPIGTYKIRATGQAFQAFETNPSRLEAGQTARVDLQMQPGVS